MNMQISSHLATWTKQAWSTKDVSYGKRALLSSGTQQVILGRKDTAILPARVANDSLGFGSSCLLMEQAILTFNSSINFFVSSFLGSRSIVNPPPPYDVILPQCDRPSSSFSVLKVQLW